MHSDDCEASHNVYEEVLAKLDTLLDVPNHLPNQKYNYINNKEDERKKNITKHDSYQCHFGESSTHLSPNIKINSYFKNKKIQEKTPWKIITCKNDKLKEQDQLENILHPQKIAPLYAILKQFLEKIGKGKKTDFKSLNQYKNTLNPLKNANLTPNKTELNLVFNPIYLQSTKQNLNRKSTKSCKASNHFRRKKLEKMNRKRLNSSKQTNISCKRISYRTSVYSTTHQPNRIKSGKKVLENKKCKKRFSETIPPFSISKIINKVTASQKNPVAEPPSDRVTPSKRKLEELSDICKQTRTVNLLCKQLSELSSTSERIRMLSPSTKTKQTYINCRKMLKPCKEEGTVTTITEQKELKPSVLKEIQHAKRKYESFNVNSNVSLRSIDIIDRKYKPKNSVEESSRKQELSLRSIDVNDKKFRSKNSADESSRKQELKTIYSRNLKEHNVPLK